MKVNLEDINVNASYETLPAGTYTVRLSDYGIKTAQTGNEYMNCEFVVTTGEYEGRKLWDKIVFTLTALWKLKALALAVKYPQSNGTDVETDDIFGFAQGVDVKVKVIVDKFIGKSGSEQTSNKIDAYLFEEVRDDDIPFDN